MKNAKQQSFIFYFCVVILLFTFYFLLYESNAQVNINANIPSICGNNVIDSGEECDGSDLGGATCQSRGYSGGTLSCGIGCVFNISSCSSEPTFGGYYMPPQTFVGFSGKAYPQAKVFLLKDSQLSGAVVSGASGDFQISLNGISAGNYIFSIYAEDDEKMNSGLVNFPIRVDKEKTVQIVNIIIPPTINTDKSEAARDSKITIFGQAAPAADINILISSDKKDFSVKTVSGENGDYFYNFNTSLFDYGDYEVKAKMSVNNLFSGFGRTVNFIIGTKDIKKEEAGCLIADLNCDGRVDLVDFSIAAYWYKRPLPLASVDLNNDRIVDLIDFSIISYWWTG